MGKPIPVGTKRTIHLVDPELGQKMNVIAAKYRNKTLICLDEVAWLKANLSDLQRHHPTNALIASKIIAQQEERLRLNKYPVVKPQKRDSSVVKTTERAWRGFTYIPPAEKIEYF